MKTTLQWLRSWVCPPILSAGASIIVTVAGLCYLAGWYFDVAALNGAVAALPKLSPNTALSLTLAAIALALSRTVDVSRGRRVAAVGCAVVIVVIGLLTLIDYVVGTPLVRHRPSFYAALVLMLFGLSLCILDVRPRRGPQPAQLLTLIGLHILLLAILGQAFHNPTLYVKATAGDGGMALPTSVLGTILGIGILSARPNIGFTVILRSAGAGGIVARRLLLVPIVLPMALLLIVWAIQRANIVGQNFSGWLLTTAYFTAFTLIIWWVASVIRRTEAQRDRAENVIRGLNDDLERRVAERTAELTEVNRHLAYRNKENETFVYSVSHDLRSPLVNLQGFSKELATASRAVHDLLADDRLPAEIRQRGQTLIDGDMAESIHFIQSAVLRLGAIIDALLRLSRAGRVQYQMQPVDLNVAMGRIVEALHGTIHERNARVTARDLPPAWGDPTAVEQVFANLVGNALNYLDPRRPGEIEIGVTGNEGGRLIPGNGQWRIYHVRDNGMGIPEAHRSKVFQAFQRLHPAAAPGEGMGLAIVHRIIERHGGKIWLDSAPGAGTTFFVALPATAAAHQGGLPD